MRIDLNKVADRIYDFFFTPTASACSKVDESEAVGEEVPGIIEKSPISLSRTEIITIAKIQHPELDECSLDNIQADERWGVEDERIENFCTAAATYLVMFKYDTSLNRQVEELNENLVEGRIRDKLNDLENDQKKEVAECLAGQLMERHGADILDALRSTGGRGAYRRYCRAPRGGKAYPRLFFTGVTMGDFLKIIDCVVTPKEQATAKECDEFRDAALSLADGPGCDLEGCPDNEITSNFARIEMLRRLEILGLLESSMPTFDITSVSPRSTTQGASQVAFTINGTATNVENVQDNLAIDIGEGVTVTNLSYDGDQINATLSIASNASISRRDVIVLVDLGNGELEEIGKLENGFTVMGTQVSRPKPPVEEEGPTPPPVTSAREEEAERKEVTSMIVVSGIGDGEDREGYREGIFLEFQEETFLYWRQTFEVNGYDCVSEPWIDADIRDRVRCTRQGTDKVEIEEIEWIPEFAQADSRQESFKLRGYDCSGFAGTGPGAYFWTCTKEE